MARQIPMGSKELVCPLHRKPMFEVCHTCPWWVEIQGENPQTGEKIDETWRCAVGWLPLLIIENAQQTRQAGAATESMRNEIIRRMDRPVGLPLELNRGLDAVALGRVINESSSK